MSKARDLSVDVAKGLGIIAVVLGHSGNPDLSVWVNWFHMPLFFLVSGYLYRPRSTVKDLTLFTKRQAKNLLIPYFIYGVLIALAMAVMSANPIMTNLKNLVYGGSLLGGVFGPFWFITSFFLTKVIFAWVLHYIKQTKVVYGLIGLLYIIGHVISRTPALAEINYIWSIETLTMTMFFYGIGYYAKDWISQIKESFLPVIVGVVLFIGLIVLYQTDTFIYLFNIKDTLYANYILDLFIPIILVLAVLALSSKIPARIGKWFASLGQESMTIMYLHILVILVADQIFAPFIANQILLLIMKASLGIAAPYIFHRLLIKFTPKLAEYM